METTKAAKHSGLFQALIEVVGQENCSGDIEDLISYSRDLASPLVGECIPDIAVLPSEGEQVQEIVKTANRFCVPVYPYTFGTNVSGAALPKEGGILLDLKRMNRIIEINRECMAATIEPGVSWKALDKRAREKGLQVPLLGGPYTGSPVANFTNAPVSHYATRFGPDRVLSLEVILGNGEILRTASSGFPGHQVRIWSRSDGSFQGNFWDVWHCHKGRL